MKFTIDLPGTPRRTSEIFIAEGLFRRIPEELSSQLGNRTAYWIWDEGVWRLWHKRLSLLGWPKSDSGRVIVYPASEANKRLSALESLARQLVEAGADRGSALVAVGGGVTGDVTGFLASIYMRGIPHFQIPTTLLAQVDSSIGGKTGVDLPEGKNLLGTFNQPRSIWMDPQFLETLPAEQFRQGMAEVIKTAIIGDEVLWKFLESHDTDIKRRDPEALIRVVSACCLLKAKVVRSDETETGQRRVLNLGHTVGHALEKLSDYSIPHGDAVAMGLMVAATVAVRMSKFPEGDLVRLKKLLEAWDLPVRVPGGFSADDVISALKTDKKRIKGSLHFILPVRIGEVVDVTDLDLKDLEKAVIILQDV